MKGIVNRLLAGVLLIVTVAACADLEVTNPNDPDAQRALATPGDVESLIGGAYYSWHRGAYWYSGPGMFLSTQSFQHSAPWANAGMVFYSWIPRPAVVNDPADQFYGNFSYPWTWGYRALSAVADGLKAINNNPAIAEELGDADVLRARAYGKFVQGLTHAMLATLYDQVFVVDETTDLTVDQTPVPYDQAMDAALGYFDEVISLASGASFTIPTNWLPTYTETTADELVAAAYSMKARYRAAVARTPAERQAVDWNAVISDVNNGVQADWDMEMNFSKGWADDVILYGSYRGWNEVANFVVGMADQSGLYQRWLDVPLLEREAIFSDGTPFLYDTPDLRFPQGTTVAEQVANPGTIYKIPTAEIDGWNIAGVWSKPDRQKWRWSYYFGYDHANYYIVDWRSTEIDIDEMNLLKAEGYYYQNNLAEVANIINTTRTAAGLNATDATGTNTSCVPKLPDETCGDLWEMLKWEKRHEARMDGLMSAPWYFDSRGWGDLWVGTQLQFPVPCQELQVLQMLPCYTFGGVGGDMAAPVSTYNWPNES